MVVILNAWYEKDVAHPEGVPLLLDYMKANGVITVNRKN